ncbi:MAG: proprotein convertase P-domain-containing protein [Syntrophobacteraceae bacterium]|nr:proprotein convertase P-domain-containing protein [Syntrophobacteraceae bacterium]
MRPPVGTGVGPIVLHQREGGPARDLSKTYDAATTPALAALAGKSCRGKWTLVVRDAAAQDFGTLVSFSLMLSFVHPDRAPGETSGPAS